MLLARSNEPRFLEFKQWTQDTHAACFDRQLRPLRGSGLTKISMRLPSMIVMRMVRRCTTMRYTVDAVALWNPFERLHSLQTRTQSVACKAHHDCLSLVVSVMCNKKIGNAVRTACPTKRLIPQSTSICLETLEIKDVEVNRPCQRHDSCFQADYAKSVQLAQ